MMTRFRAWGLYQGYSTEICMDCFDAFTQEASGWGLWRFRVPSGQGEHVLLTVGMRLDPHENRLRMLWYRYPIDGNPSSLPDAKTRPADSSPGYRKPEFSRNHQGLSGIGNPVSRQRDRRTPTVLFFIRTRSIAWKSGCRPAGTTASRNGSIWFIAAWKPNGDWIRIRTCSAPGIFPFH